MLQTNDRKESRTHNRRLAKVAVQCSADTFVVNQSLVLRMSICGKKSLPSLSAKTLQAIGSAPWTVTTKKTKFKLQ